MKGSLQVKNGKYYVVIPYKDENGKEKRKWIATGLEEKGNKRKANEKLKELLRDFDDGNIELNTSVYKKPEKLLFGDYLEQWLFSIKHKVEEITFVSYSRNINVLKNYYNKKQIALADLSPYNIQEFYNELYKKGRNGNTAIHYHVLIRMALQNAVKSELVEKNVADLIDRPKKEKYQPEFYNKQELQQLFEDIKEDPLELVINIAAYYGLRRSEILGLKWSAIDFENKIIKINHKVVEVDNKLIAKNKMKNKASNRTLPLIPYIEDLLLKEKAKQKENQKACGRKYNSKYLDYVCVNSMGELLKPNYITQHFKIIQKNNKLKFIRFHDLRHSCASLMLANGVGMKEIQEWLGHSTFQTTADIYAHLDYSSKVESANIISKVLDFKENKPSKINEPTKNELYEELEELKKRLDEKKELDEEFELWKKERLMKMKLKKQDESEM